MAFFPWFNEQRFNENLNARPLLLSKKWNGRRSKIEILIENERERMSWASTFLRVSIQQY